MNPTSNNRILIIDDNPSIHSDIRKILTSAEPRNITLEQVKTAVLGTTPPAPQGTSFLIDSAFQGDEGLDLVRRALESKQPYALAFVDMRMPPGWDGMTTLRELWKADPNLQVIICTAYSDYSWEEIVREIGKSANMVILKKPFDNIEVLQLAHALAEKWRLNDQVSVQLADLDQVVRQRTVELERANEKLRREIAERTAMEQQLRQAQKMEAVGQLAAGVAHDFNNILTIILGQVCLLAESPHAESITESIDDIRDSAERATSLVRQLLAFSRKQLIQPSPLDLGRVICNLGEVLRRVLGEHVALRVQPAARVPLIQGDLRMIEQVIINLAVNARDAMPQGGTLSITAAEVEIDPNAPLANTEARPGRYACLSVSDTGSGIEPEVLPHIFDPFFTTKDTGKGTGLGLASVYGIVKQHAGWLEVQSQVDRGTTFRVFFPVDSVQATTVSTAAPTTSVAGGHETLLVVEDEPAVRRLAVKTLTRYGYKVFEAESGVDAFNRFQPQIHQIDLLLTDMVMPGGMTGRELALRLQQAKPSLKLLYMTGYSRHIAGADFKPLEEINLLTKPFSSSDLLRMVRESLDDRRRPIPPPPGVNFKIASPDE